MKLRNVIIILPTLVVLVACQSGKETVEEVTKEMFLSAGNIGFNHEVLPLEEVRKIADELTSNEHFYSILIRKVNKKDYGIQFVYIADSETSDIDDFIAGIQNEYGASAVIGLDYMRGMGGMKDTLLVQKEVLLAGENEDESQYKLYLSAGNIGFNSDIMPEEKVYEVAKKMEKDKHIVSLVIRKVNEKDFGIQFIHLSKKENTDMEDVLFYVFSRYTLNAVAITDYFSERVDIRDFLLKEEKF